MRTHIVNRQIRGALYLVVKQRHHINMITRNQEITISPQDPFETRCAIVESWIAHWA